LSELQSKLSDLALHLQHLERIAVAYSGGVDSTFLLHMAVRALGHENVLAITADSPVTPRSEIERAKKLASAMGAEHLVVASAEFEDPRFRANSPDRCYICKRIRFQQLKELAKERGYSHLADGTNVDDEHDYRPGSRAARELGVASPLKSVGFTKADIREASRILGLATADLPSFACLASRIPYGTPLDADILSRVESGERVLAGIGVRQYRLRHHDDIARLEVSPDDFGVILKEREYIVMALRKLGYQYVTLDLGGYRSGSLNEVLV